MICGVYCCFVCVCYLALLIGVAFDVYLLDFVYVFVTWVVFGVDFGIGFVVV